MDSKEKSPQESNPSVDESQSSPRANITIPQNSVPEQAPIAPAPPVAATQGLINQSPNLVPPVEAGSSAGVLILQWLTYAFWGWAVLSLSVLTGLVITNFLNGSDTGESTPYAIAAVLVLLPISVICDFFYSKNEPKRKTGGALIVMVIHAVIFALFGIGAVIAAVFSVVQLATSSQDSTPTVSTLITAAIIAVIYGLTFVRTLNPVESNVIKKAFTVIMIIVVGLITILGFVGPVASARLTRDDKLIERQLPMVESGIRSYVSANDKLPATLSEVELKGDGEKLVERGLVKYTPNTRPVKSNTTVERFSNSKNLSVPATSLEGRKTFYYTLCVTYKKASKSDYSYPESSLSSDGGYSDYLSTYGHPEGNVCYKLKQTSYDN